MQFLKTAVWHSAVKIQNGVVVFCCFLNWEFFSLKLGKNMLFAIWNMTQYQSSKQAKKTPVIYIHRGDEGLLPTVAPSA